MFSIIFMGPFASLKNYEKIMENFLIAPKYDAKHWKVLVAAKNWYGQSQRPHALVKLSKIYNTF